jgi:magnesium transporter
MKKIRRPRSKKLHSKKIGLPPGALVHVGEIKTAQPAVSIFEYEGEQFSERTLTAPDIATLKPPLTGKLWLNVHGVHDAELIKQISQAFALHPLVTEDILNTDQRPKVDSYDNYLYIVARCFYYDQAHIEISSEQISLVLGRNFVLTFQERATGAFEPVRERMRADRAHIRELGADYLAYALLDVTVDRYFIVLEQMTDDCELLEEELLRKPNVTLLHNIHQFKGCSMQLRRAVWPLREVINALNRNDGNFFAVSTLPYLRDVYDHSVHVIESLEAIRDLLGGMMDIYLSSVSNRVNLEVRALTVVAMLFMPATLVAGIFGMNFKYMPFLEDPDGFWVAMGLTGSFAIIMGLIFWRRQWLNRQ